MAFEKGNTLAAKRRQFEATVWRALAGEDFAKLRRIVDNMLDQAIAGERWAVEMVRDTLDGKPAQQIIATDEDGRGLAVALIAYSPAAVRPDDSQSDIVRSNDPVQVHPKALPAPDPAETGQRH